MTDEERKGGLRSTLDTVGAVLDFLNDPADESGERAAKKAAGKPPAERARVLAFLRAPEHANWTAAAFAAAIERGDHAK